MGVGLELLLSHSLADIDPGGVDGHLIASRQLDLDSIAHDNDLPGIGEFVSFTREEAETLAEDMKWDAPEGVELKGKWFPAEQGHQLFTTLCRTIEADPDEFDDAHAVLPELRKVRDILQTASEHNVRFRLAVDY